MAAHAIEDAGSRGRKGVLSPSLDEGKDGAELAGIGRASRIMEGGEIFRIDLAIHGGEHGVAGLGKG